MTSNLKTRISKNLEEKSILVTRTFNAPLPSVWRAYTESDLLDQWWGPEPWRAETKFMDFSEGGHWLYAMVGPDGTRHWARMNYKAIVPQRTIEGEDGFCDEDGHLNPDMPVNQWVNQFVETDGGTRVEHTLTFETLEGLQAIVDMGFETGFSIGLDQLEALLSKQNL
ncbi:MAG: SRPBCC domain-containing protein [Saprospiraceae bacterium]|nr:SRPBCC domain-containing protein [Candidatus Opimibacter iunctus]